MVVLCIAWKREKKQKVNDEKDKIDKFQKKGKAKVEEVNVFIEKSEDNAIVEHGVHCRRC